jgi:hypothetical protein
MNQTNTVMLVVLVGLGVFYMPQMIGSANAQSSQASERVCPTGYTLSQGRCTAEPTITLECARIDGFIPRQTGTNCFVNGPANVITAEACSSFGGNYGLIAGTNNAFCQYPTTIQTINCPGGITPTSGQCIVKPGQRDQP